MSVMWSPWRSKYIETFKDEKVGDEEKCFLCEAAADKEHSDELLILSRKEKCFVIMNKFPYNSGHLLIAPYRHIGEFEDLETDELNNMMKTAQESIKVLKSAYNPHGYNLGINIGRVSGAGVPGHIHLHIVPRWNGDTNFMPVLADIKVVSESLQGSIEKLRAEYKKIVL